MLKRKCSSIIQSKNIEDFLSFTILYEKLNGEIKDKNGDSLRNKLEKKIADACRLKLDVTNKHHQDFIRKVTARKPSEPRVQLYTTNYDTLFEQAAQKMNFTIIDGFHFLILVYSMELILTMILYLENIQGLNRKKVLFLM